MRIQITVTAFVLTSCWGLNVQANLITNGGFETPVAPSGSSDLVSAGSSALFGWAITTGDVNVVDNGLWQAFEGTQSLDLNGTQPGTISQSIATTAGTDYSLSFAYANNFGAGNPVAMAELKVSGASSLLDQTITHSGSTANNMSYVIFSGSFVADSPTSTLQFKALNSGPWGITLDAISVVAHELGDYNHNSVVDAADYTVWRDTLSSTTNLAADGNGNGTIDTGDYGVWKSNFGHTLATAGLTGDYNHNGIVDAADYTVWRNTLGSTSDFRANGDNTGASAGRIDQADYTVWKTNFGNHAGSGAGAVANASVPEPATLTLLIVASAGILLLRRRRAVS
jgi:choice-of-anchor C domain-containing protein